MLQADWLFSECERHSRFKNIDSTIETQPFLLLSEEI